MGLTKAVFRLRGRKGKEELELIVDTGSVYTWAPGGVLERLGVAKTDRVGFATIEGRRIRRYVGEALVEYDGVSRHCVVVFGQPGDASVLGVTALENLALEVDPVSRKLRRAKAVATEVVVEGLRGIEKRIEALLETFEIVSDKKPLENIKESLREAEKGRGRSIKEIIADPRRVLRVVSAG